MNATPPPYVWSAPAPVPNLTVTNFAGAVRARTVALLKTLNTLAGQYVDSTRVEPIDRTDAPRIAVYMDNRSYVLIGQAAPQYDCTGRLTVVGYVTGAPHGEVESNTELLGEQIIGLMDYQPFLAGLQQISSIDMTFELTGEADRFEGVVVVTFEMKWVEVFEPVLAPAPNGYGAPLQTMVVTVENSDGDVMTGATISLSQS